MTLNTEHCKLSNQNIMRKIKQLFLKGGKCHRIIELNSTGTSMDGNISFHLKKDYMQKNYNDQGLKNKEN